MDPELRGRLQRVVKLSMTGALRRVIDKKIDVDAAAEAVTWDVVDAFRVLVCSHCGKAVADDDWGRDG